MGEFCVPINEYIHQIEIGCDAWEDSQVLTHEFCSKELQKTPAPTTAEPAADLLAIDHHQVLDLTLIHFANLQTSAHDKGFDLATPKRLSLYFTSRDNIRQINSSYRGKDKATNVLSFESDLPNMILSELDYTPLGELVFSLEVIKSEARDQGKSLADHYTHLLVHGCLHLLGMDHEISEADQQQMESLEVLILSELKIKNPYEDQSI